VRITDGIDGCLLARFSGPAPPWLRRWLDGGLAGVVLFAGNIAGPDQLRSLVAQLREHNPDVLIAVDEEGGIVTRMDEATGSSYPGNAALGAVDDVALTGQIAQSIGAMLAAAGLSLNLAPVTDLDGFGQPGHRRAVIRRRSARGGRTHRRFCPRSAGQHGRRLRQTFPRPRPDGRRHAP
jgi:Glycosyl hydrolase family 3 N terminal domain